MQRILILVYCFAATVACDLKKKKAHSEIVETALLTQCKEISSLFESAAKEENFDSLALQTCAKDSDCVSSPDIFSCSGDSCMIGCTVPRNRENDAKAKNLLKNKKYKKAEAALNSKSARCSKLIPSCAPGEVHCDKTNKICKWKGKA